MTEPAISVRGLSKRYGAQVAVESVDLIVPRGTIHGLLGPNGAGKTTLLRMLLGLVRPDAGTIHLGGRPLSSHEPPAALGIAGFVEAPSFYPYLSASRNLELLARWDSPSAAERIGELLVEVGLGDRASSKVRGFSTGMRQRLGLAAALLNDPAVLVVDEPTTGLDPAGMRDLHGLLQAWRDDGRTVLLSSHDLEEVEQLCDQVSVLRAGRVVYGGSISALRERTAQRGYRLRTSDDAAAQAVATAVEVESDEAGLTLRGEQADVDRFVLDLAAGGIAVRELTREQLPFESLFFQLTEEA